MTSHDERRKQIDLFLKGLGSIVAADDQLVGCFVILFTESGRSLAFMTASCASDPKTTAAEITRSRNSFGNHHGVTAGELSARMAAIARLEDGLFEGSA